MNFGRSAAMLATSLLLSDCSPGSAPSGASPDASPPPTPCAQGTSEPCLLDADQRLLCGSGGGVGVRRCLYDGDGGFFFGSCFCPSRTMDAAYRPCTSDLACGLGYCGNVAGGGQRICMPPCQHDADCPVPADLNGADIRCLRPGSATVCTLHCTAVGQCPSGLTCRSLPAGSLGFCG